ncbi:MAG: hypothetical protein AMXMBFR33_01570 [Candidatus Xenobia bacterium]
MAHKDPEKRRAYQRELMRKRRAEAGLAKVRGKKVAVPLQPSSPVVLVVEARAELGTEIDQARQFVQGALAAGQRVLSSEQAEPKEIIAIMRLAKELWPMAQAFAVQADEPGQGFRDLRLPERALSDAAVLELMAEMLRLSTESDQQESDDWPDS